ncbi:MAG TPA: glycosyltransferase family 39 protein [Vicinamibacterales bacterium]|nr:glycosyltransferase family 39 protein [Vicinamibacterales bacterium]
MYQGLRLSRLWLALIVAGFCLPLFIGLGRADLETDEAIYSFAVDRIVEIGDWLEPKSSPSETDIFLEKPPLKFWMVAAPIEAGLLPHDEFGLRFLDALAGGVAFLYVFAIGSLLAGPVCGAVAVLLLFIHDPLLSAHGLRSNNMEASLVLSYCAGVFHFLRWSALDDVRRRSRHAMWAGLYFALGFMTKFVAALFLPITLGLAALAFPRVRARLVQDWPVWLRAAVVVLVVCAPWFVYATVRFGWQLWDTILGEHVLRRMTAFLDPTHVHPWYWYLQRMWSEFVTERTEWLAGAGLATLLLQSIRRRWFEGAVVCMWAVVPLAIISSGTSKLYHYAYPFLPPIALAAGYLVALVVMLAPVLLRKVLERVEDLLDRAWPSGGTATEGSWHRTLASAIVIGASAVAVAAVAMGGLRLDLGGITLKSSGVLRPVVLIVLIGLATRTSARTGRLAVALIVFSAMPLAAYRGQLERLPDGTHPIRAAAECVQRVQAEHRTGAGLLIDMPDGIWHPLYYYFRRVRPVSLAVTPLDPSIDVYLHDAARARPVLLSDGAWREYVTERSAVWAPGDPALRPPMLLFLNSVLLLPGPYAACSSEAVLRSSR